MSGSIELWQLYGSREDTDAAVVRHLDRQLGEAEGRANSLQHRLNRIEFKLEEIGLSYRAYIDKHHVEGIGTGRAFEDGIMLTKEDVETLLALHDGTLELVEVVRTDDQQADAES